MTIKSLHCHPATPCASIRSLTVAIERNPEGGLILCYRLDGDIETLVIPAAKPPAAADGLWRHTCFEAFIAGETAGYHEFNLSPSGQWAAYAFSRYRERTPWAIGKAPIIDITQAPRQLLLSARIAAADLPPAGRLRLGLSAVIEAADGTLSYWALRHPGERPDFHDPAGFAHWL